MTIESHLLRRTRGFEAYEAKRGVTIRCRERKAYPRQRTVTFETFQILNHMNDDSFDGSCVIDLGIGCFQRM